MSTLKACVAVFSIVLVLPVPLVNAASQAAPAPGVATGQKIGNIIKTAISTAAPGISSILNLIWPSRENPGSDNTKKTEKQAKSDLDAAAQKPEVQNRVQAQFVAAAQQKLQPVGKVAAELAVLNKFLEPSVLASGQLIVIRTQLKQNPPPWASMKTNFELAKQQLQKVKGVSDNDLNSIRDLYLRDKLKHIKDANDAPSTLIDADIAGKDSTGLAVDLSALSATLSDMTAMAGYELADLESDITELANWARGAGGGPVPAKQDVYKQFLDQQLQ